MNYEIIPQDYRDLINNQYPQINDEHKKQLTQLWNIMLQIGGGNEQQTGPQFIGFLQQQITNINDVQSISHIIDLEIANMEGLHRPKRKMRQKRSYDLYIL
jgi:hypothetical protein